MQFNKNILVTGSKGKQMPVDIAFATDGKPHPVVIYAHGFNGFKDWGNFDLIAAEFVNAGFTFVKFNFSHNGTTPAQPEVFTDLEAFGNNNYTIQLHDLDIIISWVVNPRNQYKDAIDVSRLSLVGHSMGGGIAILQTAVDKRIHKLVTWAAICECNIPWGNWPEAQLQQWKEEGVQYYANGRTHQQMPLYYQLYEDHVNNAGKLNIQQAIRNITIPVLICHGTLDTAVPFEKALTLKAIQPEATLFEVETDHVFGRRHPWEEPNLPLAMQMVVDETILFLQ